MITEQLREVSINRLFETKSFNSAWKTWKNLLANTLIKN